MKHFITILLFTLTAQAHAYGDAWTGQDKTRHAEWSAGYGIITSAAINEQGKWNWKAFALAMVPGIVKEYRDSTRTGGSGWSNRDLVADAFGASLGVAFAQNTVVEFRHRKDETRVSVAWKF